jgi:hypothetical protein
MPKRKEKIETIIIPDQEEITPNKTNLMGAIRIKGNTKNAKERITITSEQTSHMPFVVNTAIILTIAPK